MPPQKQCVGIFLLLAGIFLLAGPVSGQSCRCPPDFCCDREGICGTGDDFCGTGCLDGPCYTPLVNVSSDYNNVSVSDMVSEVFFNDIINHADADCPGKRYYSRGAFIEALDYDRSFGREGSDENATREVAAFFAHVTYSTAYFCYIEQINGASRDYCDVSSMQYPCVAGKRYHGRGPIQLTWNFNYGPAGRSIGFDGLNEPETVATDPVVGFKTALWFWQAHVHPVVAQGFGATIRAVNGAEECNGGNRDAVQARATYYVDYCNQLGVSPGENLIC